MRALHHGRASTVEQRTEDPSEVPKASSVPLNDPLSRVPGGPVPEGGHPQGGGGSERVYFEQAGGSRSRPDPWRDPIGALWEEFQSRRTPSPEGRVREVPGAISAEHNRAGGAEESSTTAILEALTKNLVGLQELQLKTMKKEGDDDSPEQVKNTSVILPALLGPEEPSAGIVFQDWLAQVSVPMQDLSASSSIWWQQVLKMVQATYNKWLSANPLERLQLEPADQEALTTMKWTRVNSRACTLILQCLVETVRSDLIARRAVQSMPAILFRLHTCYQPGGASERSAVLGNLQNPTHPTTIEEALTFLRAWPRWLQRCKDLNMMVPDGSVLARALTTTTAPFLKDSPDAQFRTQLLRSSLRIDAQPTVGDVLKYQQHLQAEVESMMAARSMTPLPTPALKAMGTTTPSSSPSNAGGAKQPCKYFLKPTWSEVSVSA